MKVAFDYQMFAAQRYGGVTRYYTALVRELALLGETPRVIAPLHWNQHLQQLPSHLVRGTYVERFLPGKAFYLNVLFNRWSTRLQISVWRPDVVHETYYAAKRTGPASIPTVVTVYDMIHELFVHQFSTSDRTSAAKLAAVRRADHIICISANTRDDLIRLLGVPNNRISVVHLGVDVADEELPIHESQPGPTKFLLYVGDRRGYKNFTGFLEAFASSSILRRDLSIIAFGSEPFSAQEVQLIARLGLAQTIEYRRGDDFALDALYREAQALIYPSLYEGFGLPPLEAMARGCPVIASDSSSMPEVIGNAGALFDPTSLHAMVTAIESVIYSDHRRRTLVHLGRLRAKGFSWRRCATETLAVYRQVSGDGQQR
ncbi:glycosyltransferase family 1 protein [soil metagenome]